MQCLTLQKIWFFEKKDGNSDDNTNNSAEPVDESVVSETLDASKDYMENSVEYDSTENYVSIYI